MCNLTDKIYNNSHFHICNFQYINSMGTFLWRLKAFYFFVSPSTLVSVFVVIINNNFVLIVCNFNVEMRPMYLTV